MSTDLVTPPPVSPRDIPDVSPIIPSDRAALIYDKITTGMGAKEALGDVEQMIAQGHVNVLVDRVLGRAQVMQQKEEDNPQRAIADAIMEAAAKELPLEQILNGKLFANNYVNGGGMASRGRIDLASEIISRVENENRADLLVQASEQGGNALSKLVFDAEVKSDLAKGDITQQEMLTAVTKHALKIAMDGGHVEEAKDAVANGAPKLHDFVEGYAAAKAHYEQKGIMAEKPPELAATTPGEVKEKAVGA